jgi:hypothetical protein
VIQSEQLDVGATSTSLRRAGHFAPQHSNTTKQMSNEQWQAITMIQPAHCNQASPQHFEPQHLNTSNFNTFKSRTFSIS